MEKISSLTENSNFKKLYIRTIGSTEGVNKAFTIYEYEDEILLVDCGIGYPDTVDMPGVDVLIPDFSYAIENFYKIKGLFLTHGHADHIAAVPYFLQQLPNIHIYGSKFVLEMVKSSLQDRNFKHLSEGTHLHLFDPSQKSVDFNYFSVSSFGINHSVPESQGFAIKTPEGTVLHIADYKFDATPVLDKPFDETSVKKLSEKGVLALLSDCLSVEKKGGVKSERSLDDTFVNILKKAENKQVFITILSSNVSRMYQIIHASIKFNRKVVASGRSVENVLKISKNLGYLNFPDSTFVSEQESSSYDQGSLVYIIAGCYGQPESSLGRLSRNEHSDISLKKDAIVVFSGDPGPPEIAVPVEKLTDTFILQGIEVIDSNVMENLHVSGHGGQDDMIRLAKLVNPKYFIPIGGTITKMHRYKKLMGSLGFNEKNVFECLEGDSVEFSNGNAKKSEHINISPVYISATRGEQLSAQIIKDRDTLCTDGVFVVIVVQDKKSSSLIIDSINIVTRGFIYVKDSKELMDMTTLFIKKSILKRTKNKLKVDGREWSDIKRGLEKDIDRFLYTKIGRSPLIVVHALQL